MGLAPVLTHYGLLDVAPWSAAVMAPDHPEYGCSAARGLGGPIWGRTRRGYALQRLYGCAETRKRSCGSDCIGVSFRCPRQSLWTGSFGWGS